MRFSTAIATLIIFAALSPPALTQSAPPEKDAKDAGKSSALSLNETPLTQCVGRRVTVKSQLTKLPNNRIGIILSKKPFTQISIDALPCTKSGELPFKLLVSERGQSVARPKYHKRSAKKWIENDARQKRLEQLIEQHQLGESIEITGTLCHMTSTTRGSVQKNINYPQVPESHYFFSVDDITVLPMR